MNNNFNFALCTFNILLGALSAGINGVAMFTTNSIIDIIGYIIAYHSIKSVCLYVAMIKNH